MQQADRDHIDVVDLGNRSVERFDLGTRSVESPTHLEPRGTRDEGRRSVDVLVVERRPRLARDLDDVREAAGRHERDAADLALEQGVGRHRRPVRQELGRLRGDLRDRRADGDDRDRRASKATLTTEPSSPTRSVKVPPASTPMRTTPGSHADQGSGAVAGVALDFLEEVATGAHGAHLEPERRDAAPETQHVHVERVPGGAAARPRPPYERVAADHRAEPVDERGRERALDRGQRDPPPTMAEQPVAVDGRRRHRLAGAGREGGDARPEVVLGRREPDPVLEGIDGGRGGEAFPHQEEPGRTDGSEAFESCLLFGPAKKDDIGTGLRIHHKEKVKSRCFHPVTAK